jgi:hypothetical protein
MRHLCAIPAALHPPARRSNISRRGQKPLQPRSPPAPPRDPTGTGDIGQAQEYLAKRLIELRETKLYGARELRSFRTAATKYLQEHNHKKRIKDDALQLRQLDPFIGSLELRQVHMGNLQAFIARRRQDGVKTKTLNMALAVVRRVLNLASSEWMDRAGKTWLETAPKIKLFPIKDARSPYPLSREEQGEVRPRTRSATQSPATTWLRRKSN